MADPFLYQSLDAFSKFGGLNTKLPDSLTLNLNQIYELRPYQVEAFARFLHCHKQDFPGKVRPLHLLFNMATGSGKTLIMAGLILYLYEQGYRNYLFFVNSTNIIEKTKDNFLNPGSIKYLFADHIFIGGRRVYVSPVENFEAANPDDINICFTTIQKLHSDLTTERENSITFEDFRKYPAVLLADEAHHMNVETRAEMEMFESWESTVQEIFEQNEQNLLLEFTATQDYETPAMVDKYRNKVIIRYDLVQFRNDGFSKDLLIVQSDFSQDDRILQAVILNQYKKEVAAKHRINLKPVILFKAQRTISQSQENKTNFHRLIQGLGAKRIARIRKSDIPLVQRAFRYFDDNGTTDAQLAERLKAEFHEDYCISVNEESQKENLQILLNTLEDQRNQIRAIFAVQKLNEGWDVLNLFDIVRCYETRDARYGQPGSTTISEAQLIGRGARYFPFVTPDSNDRFRRKFDEDLEADLRVIEELHYHSINDSRYIAEITQALVREGMLSPKTVERRLELKDAFKKNNVFKRGVIFLNRRVAENYDEIHSFVDLGVHRKNFVHEIATGHGDASAVLVDIAPAAVISDETAKDIPTKSLPSNILQSAIARNPFFTFASLRQYFPHLSGMEEFARSNDYLGGLAITFRGNLYRLEEDSAEKLAAVIGLLRAIEKEVRKQITPFRGSKEFSPRRIRDIFTDKLLKFDGDNPRAADDPQFAHFVSDKNWFVFNTLYGTSEEKAFVRMLQRWIGANGLNYDDIYLLRNEGHFTIFEFDQGRPFEPDFLFVLRDKAGSLLTYQVFIEPKGKFLQKTDQWKADFLRELTTQFKGKAFKVEDRGYRLTGVPFYNNDDENLFREALDSALA